MNWISVGFLFIIAEILDLETQAIDFVLEFSQADLEVPVCMELPTGMNIPNNSGRGSGYYVLGLKNYFLWA